MLTVSLFRYEKAYLYANEALCTDYHPRSEQAVEVRRKSLYALAPLKRRADVAERLHRRGKALVREGIERMDSLMLARAQRTLRTAMWWHCTPGMLETRAEIAAFAARLDGLYG